MFFESVSKKNLKVFLSGKYLPHLRNTIQRKCYFYSCHFILWEVLCHCETHSPCSTTDFYKSLFSFRQKRKNSLGISWECWNPRSERKSSENKGNEKYEKQDSPHRKYIKNLIKNLYIIDKKFINRNFFTFQIYIIGTNNRILI